MRRLPTAVLAAATLIAGFAVAQVSGVRAAGAAVLVAGVAWCVAREARRTPAWRLVAVVLVGAACFALSHALADALGAWPSVLLAAAVLGYGTTLLVDRRRSSRASWVSA